MAPVMILGSLVAGSTPMGGGAISFPYLVSWLGLPPNSARDFGLMIQALGMTSAMIYVLCRRIPLQRHMLLWTAAGSTVGIFLGSAVVAPHIPANIVKLSFACMWMSFAILTLAKNHEFCRAIGVRTIDSKVAMRAGLLVGLVGGLIASVIGVGVEMVLYITLILLYRCDLKIAVPTAVSAMAITSIMGVAARLWLGDISRDLVLKFLAAGPFVIFGAPIGTYIVSVIPRLRTLYFISLLCVGQFVWTLHRSKRTYGEWAFIIIAIALASAVFYSMYRRGKRETEIIAGS